MFWMKMSKTLPEGLNKMNMAQHFAQYVMLRLVMDEDE
jgi:hypothetical protein